MKATTTKKKPAAKKPKETPREKYNRENLEQVPEIFAPAHALTDEKLKAALVCAQNSIDYAIQSLQEKVRRLIEVARETESRAVKGGVA